MHVSEGESWGDRDGEEGVTGMGMNERKRGEMVD
jgi:hypothetical protein